jgi:threonine/homoserine/homoserine lactone efflux protein
LSNLPVFILAAFILLLTPGPAVLYIVARSIDQGRRAGLVSVLGIEAGNFVHVLAATLGLSAILRSSPMAFSLVKYLGAAYLVYLGVRRLLTHTDSPQSTEVHPQSLKRIYTQGVTVAVLNPKTALFFFAFLPQFVDLSGNAATAQLFLLGCIFVGMALITDSAYALLAGTAGEWLKRSPGFLLVERYIVGLVYIGLGVMALLTDIQK